METISFDQAAEMLGVKTSRVHQLVKEYRLLSQAGPDGKKGLVADSLIQVEGVWQPVEHLRGTMLSLLDGGFSVPEATAWLLSENEYFPLTPLQQLREGAHKKVNRVTGLLAL